jgi:hypothetical protein
MIYAAELDSENTVLRVICAESIIWCKDNLGGESWYQAWRDGGQRFNFPAAGFTFDPIRNAFIPPKPYPSWVLNESTCNWDSPVAMPPGGPWEWDEDIEEWVAA